MQPEDTIFSLFDTEISFYDHVLACSPSHLRWLGHKPKLEGVEFLCWMDERYAHMQ
jgi:hypothetical protein